MKRVLFVIPSMEFGGTRSSLINLLNNLEGIKNVSVDLLIINHEGDLMKQIPKWVGVIPESKIIAYSLPNVRRKNLTSTICHVIVAILNRLLGYQLVFTYLCRLFGGTIFGSSQKYDTVIAYQEGISVLIGSLISSSKHVVWIHSDVDKWYSRRTFERKAYNNAGKIVFVAENTKRMFTDLFPEYIQKCIVIKNTLNVKNIIAKSNESVLMQHNSKGLNLISIGRFTQAKAFDRIVFVCKVLKEKKYDFSWTLVGDGELFKNIKRIAKENNVEDVMRFVGAQSNPYAFIANADIVVVSSLNESQPMVILESLTLSKPILSTAFGSSKEVLENGKYGLICNNDIVSLTSAVVSLFTDFTILPRLRKAARNYKYSNSEIIEQVLQMIE